jgi:hypothetical protein
MKYKFSPSKINLLKDCPKCFWLEHNKQIKRPDGIFPSLPNGMDKILKVHFDNYANQDKLPPELKEIDDGTLKIFNNKVLLDKWRNNFKGIVYTDEKFWIRGAVDAVLMKGDTLIVLDYKTRGYPLKEDTHHHYIEQQAFYNYLLQKNGYKTKDYSYLLFYHPDKVVDEVFLFHADLIKIETPMSLAENLIKKALKVLDGPCPDQSNECKFCKFRDIGKSELNQDNNEKNSNSFSELKNNIKEKTTNLLNY